MRDVIVRDEPPLSPLAEEFIDALHRHGWITVILPRLRQLYDSRCGY